jgi:hypothetical protein
LITVLVTADFNTLFEDCGSGVIGAEGERGLAGELDVGSFKIELVGSTDVDCGEDWELVSLDSLDCAEEILYVCSGSLCENMVLYEADDWAEDTEIIEVGESL